jgi:hypothetical protein
MKIKYLICLFLLLSVAGCEVYSGKSGTSSDKELMPKISIEEVIDMDLEEIGELPIEYAGYLIYDLCQEVKRLRKE